MLKFVKNINIMYSNKLILLIWSLCICHIASAQSRYAENLRTFVGNEWISVPHEIILKPLDKKNPTEFQVKCDSKPTRKQLKNFALFLQHNDSLYINAATACNIPINNGFFTKAYHINDSTILFTEFIEKVPKFYAGVGSTMIPIGVNPFTNPYKLQNRFCFIINTKNKYTVAEIVTPEMAEELLAPFPGLLAEYKNKPEKQRVYADVLIELFSRAGLLK